MPKVIEGVRLYSVNEVCLVTGFSYPTILKRMENGDIENEFIGRSRVTTRKQLVDYLKTLDFPENLIEHRLEKAGIETPSVNGEAQ